MKKIITYWKKQQAFKQTYRELSNLSTRELDDIGINRTMITRIAQEQADRIK